MFKCGLIIWFEGEIYKKAAQMYEKAGMPRPVILAHIEEINSLKPGPNAGKEIG